MQRAARKAERGGADGRAENIERRHRDLEALARRAEPRGDRHAHIVELQRRQRMRRDHLDPLGHRQARRIGIDHEGRQAFRAGRFAAAREDDVMIGDAAIGDPGLGAARAAYACCRRASRSSRAPRHRSRHPARTMRRPRSPCRRAPAADSGASSRASRKARSIRCRAPASRRRNRRGRHGRPRISRARQSVRTSSCGCDPPNSAGTTADKKSGLAQRLHARAAGGVDIVMRQLVKRGFRPARQLRGETPVTVIEERPGQRLGERHVSCPRRPVSASPRRRDRRA